GSSASSSSPHPPPAPTAHPASAPATSTKTGQPPHAPTSDSTPTPEKKGFLDKIDTPFAYARTREDPKHSCCAWGLGCAVVGRGWCGRPAPSRWRCAPRLPSRPTPCEGAGACGAAGLDGGRGLDGVELPTRFVECGVAVGEPVGCSPAGD